MEAKMLEELNHSAQAFTVLLGKVERQLPAPERESIRNLQQLVGDFRVKLLEREVRKKYPGVNPHLELIDLVGTEPEMSLEEEKVEIRKALERKVG